MGDSRRHEVFAKFVENVFPVTRYPTVLCVADGKMDLAKELRSRGYTVTVYEPNPRDVSHSHRFRKEVNVKRRAFTRDTVVDPKPSLIVGMHPDEATVEIMKWASLNRGPLCSCSMLRQRRYKLYALFAPVERMVAAVENHNSL